MTETHTTPTMETTRENDDDVQMKEDDDDPWKHVGGNAVNEKTRRAGRTAASSSSSSSSFGFDPLHNKAHLYHALEGLERYPRYLSRWNNQAEIDALEQALQAQLNKVRQQRHEITQHRHEMKQLVQEFLNQNSSSSFRSTLLRRPASWNELKQRNIFDANFIRAVEQSWKRQRQAHTAALSSTTTHDDSYYSSKSPPLPWEQGADNDDTTDNGDTGTTITTVPELVLEAGQLEPLMEQEAPDVYSIPILQPAFCQSLMEYLRQLSEFRQARHEASQKTGGSSSLHTRWMDLDHVGLSWLNDLLLSMVMQPIARHLFAPYDTDGIVGHNNHNNNNNANDDVKTSSQPRLDWRQGYLAAYTATTAQANQVTPRQGLVAHTDDSEVTLNVSLNGGQFQGGALELYGLRGTRQAGQWQETYEPQQGRALLHAGRYLHAVQELTAPGERFALIVWARSWSGIRATQCPCCWLQRRRIQPHTVVTREQTSAETPKTRREPQTMASTTATTEADTSSCICGAAWN